MTPAGTVPGTVLPAGAGPATGQQGVAPPVAISDEDELLACTVCDALHRVTGEVGSGSRLRCHRCGTTLLMNPLHAMDTIISSAIATSILLISSIFFPFLQISSNGLKSAASLLDTALAFSGGITAPLTLAVFMLIIVIPVVRACFLVYALMPLRLGYRHFPGAQNAFRMACELRPWSMAEVFIIGVVVALVKVGGMATVTLGPAFWELILIVLIVALEAASLSEKSIWRELELKA